MYKDFVEEFRKIMALDAADYRRDEEKGRWVFKFQREDVDGLEDL